MKKDRISGFQAGFGLIEILLVLAIILILYYAISNLYLKEIPLDKKTEQTISAQGIVTTNAKTIVDSVKKKLQESQEEESRREKEMEQ